MTKKRDENQFSVRDAAEFLSHCTRFAAGMTTRKTKFFSIFSANVAIFPLIVNNNYHYQ